LRLVYEHLDRPYRLPDIIVWELDRSSWQLALLHVPLVWALFTVKTVTVPAVSKQLIIAYVC